MRTARRSGLASECGGAGLITVGLVLAGCGPTSVQSTGATVTGLPRPDRILVYDFAVTPDEVKLDQGISADVMRYVSDSSMSTRTAEEIKIGHAVANAVSIELVQKLRSYGFFAERALGWPSRTGNTLLVKGQFVSIDEGNRTERVLIGLGTGRTSVQANVQLYDLTPQGMRRVDTLRADAKSGYKPGMALMMGVGGLAGNLVTSAVVSSVTTAGSEMSWATVEADGKRLANDVAKNLGQFFVIPGLDRVRQLGGRRMVMRPELVTLVAALIGRAPRRPPAGSRRGRRGERDRAGKEDAEPRGRPHQRAVPEQFNFNPGSKDETVYILNVQPVIPIKLTEDWNLITRTIMPIINQPSLFPADASESAFGLGDINPTLFLSPAKPGKLIWGVGPTMTLPTATDNRLGSGKWSLGPAAVALMHGRPWVFGALANQQWSWPAGATRA